MLSTDMPRINDFYQNMERQKKDNYDPMIRKENFIIPAGQIVICKLLQLHPTQDSVYPYFTLGKSITEMTREKPLLDA